MAETTTSSDLHLDYIKSYLLDEIVANFPDETLENYNIDSATGLDGFMSNLFTIELKTRSTVDDGITNKRLVIAKFMRGDDAFRTSSKSYIQFANEVFVYAEVLPTYQRLLLESGVHDVEINNWVAPAYAAKFGYIKGLSHTPAIREAVLVLKHLKPDGYRLGPRLHLRRDQLLGMCKPVAQFHGAGYALRHCKPKEFDRLKSGIIPLPFNNPQDPLDAQTNIYHVLYRVAFDRFFDFCDRKLETLVDKQKPADIKLLQTLTNLRTKYYAQPTMLMERIRTQVEDNDEDRHFAVITHGDYNRNNVLFHFATSSDDDNVEVDDVKMIDFQEMRFGSPAIDLSFFMYMNTPPNLRNEIWQQLLKTYHDHLIEIIRKIVTPKSTASDLSQIEGKYSFQNFEKHFARYAAYGVMVCMHFLPWLLCSESDCAQLSHLFETDMHGPAFYKISIEAGGDNANMEILGIVRHACEAGYFDNV